jgi:adenylate cyclase
MPTEFHVNDWLVQVELNLVSRCDRTVRIEPKAMQVLVLLAGHPNDLVHKQTLKDCVWAGTFVSDDVLVRCISELRKVLENDRRAPALIQTVNRGGYRLVARVASRQETGTATGASRAETEPYAQASVSRRVRRGAWIAGAALTCLFLAVLAMTLWPSSSAVQGLAVLPFRNLSGDAGQDHLAEVITDLLTAELAKSSDLDVSSTSSVGRYRSTKLSVAVISRELNVDALVEGSVVATRGGVTINADLVDARTARHLWSGIFQGDCSDGPFPNEAVASEVAQEIRKTLSQQSH